METTGNDPFDAAPRLGGLLETVIYSRRLEETRDFYRIVFALDLVSEVQHRHVFFRVGDGMLLIFDPESTRTDTIEVGGAVIPRHGAEGAGHFAFHAPESEMDRWRKRLVDHEIEIESEIDWPGGGRSIYCRDPAGNSVEIGTRTIWFD